MKYIPLFLLIQLASLILTVAGMPICLGLSFFVKANWAGPTYFPAWAWLWDNEEDGVCPPWYLMAFPNRPLWLNVFIWTGLRNSVANLKHVPGVSKAGRPLFYRTWTTQANEYHGPFWGSWPKAPKQWYIKAGWMSNGYPCLSAGSGRGY